MSDAVCTALQLTNFWQDLGRDWSKGRLYVPLECLAAAGAAPDDIAVVPATPAWRFALREATGHTRRLFDQGRPIARAIGGRLGWELRATWLGGVRILDRIQAAGFDVFEHRPALGWTDAARIGWRMLRWR